MSGTPDGWKTGLIGGPEKRTITIVAYRPDWPLQFQRHAARIAAALGDTARRIEHSGSTAVEGLAAKPIIDMLVVVPDAGDEDCYLPQMVAAGYELRVREPDFQEHRMFRTPERDVHVHVFPEGAGEIERYLLFRNALRKDSDARKRYEALKRALSKTDWADMNAYANAKSDFIADVVRLGSVRS